MINPVSSPNAPKAIGPYSQAIKAEARHFIFCSGQIPLDPRNGELVPGDIGIQTKQVMENLKAVLTAGGAELANVVKTTIYLQNLGDFARVNEVYGSYFTGTTPARATVQVAALPKGAQVEIDCIAVV